MDAREREKLEVLDGSRASAARRAAVRFADLGALLQLPPVPRASKAAGATPTKAEYDALLEDVNVLYRRLQEIAAVVQRQSLKR